MKKLLTGNEVFANCVNRFNDDYSAIIVEGEPRGTTKQIKLEGFDFASYLMLKMGFEKLDLDDYFEMEYDDNKLIMRIVEEN